MADIQNQQNGSVSANSGDLTKDIAIIGAGPSGLAALKSILDHPLHKEGRWRAVAYEGRGDVGGIWNSFAVNKVDSWEKYPPTAVYDSLTTNIAHPAMAFTSYAFPPSTLLYPPARTVHKYLRDFATHFGLLPHIQFNSLVRAVEWDSDRNKWKVQVRKGEQADETSYYDLVIVGSGHDRTPRYPSTPGLKAWLDSGRASHSSFYRNPSQSHLASVRKVLVVGGGPSGSDIASELYAADPSREVIHSYNEIWAYGGDYSNDEVKTRSAVKEFLPLDDNGQGSVLFEDGTIESGIGHAVLATGFQYSFPFLEPGSSSNPPIDLDYPPSLPPLPTKLYNSSYGVFPLAKQIFPLVTSFPPFSLAFINIPFRPIPFPVVEAQARAVLKVLEDPTSLDIAKETAELASRYEQLSASLPPSGKDPRDVAIAKLWHVLADESQYDYRDALHQFVGGEYAKPEWKVPDWEKYLFDKKWELRSAWKALVKTGQVEEWVKGVGEGNSGKNATAEWLELIDKVLKWAENSTKQ